MRLAIQAGFILCLVGALAAPAAGQRVRLPADFTDSVALARAMPELAEAVLGQYSRHQPADPARALDGRFRLELVAGRYDETTRSLAALRALRARAASGDPQARA